MSSLTKQYYIHVGAPKAASTFLQTKVFNNLNGVRFNDKEGLLPNYEKDKLRQLGQKLLFQDSASHSYKLLREQINIIEEETVEDKILLSEESFMGYWARGFSNGGSMALLLKDLFPNARILLSIREQVAWLESLYRHCSEGKIQKDFNVGPPSEFFYRNPDQFHWKLQRYRPTHTVCWINWHQHYMKYVHLFGRANVSLLPFEWLKQEPRRAQELLSSFVEQPIDIQLALNDAVNASVKKTIFTDLNEQREFDEHVKSINAESNGLLNNELDGIDLQRLGYTCG